MPVIDLGDTKSWPPTLVRVVARLADRLRPDQPNLRLTTELAHRDLSTEDADRLVAQACGDCDVVVSHFTRLTRIERARIRQSGVRPLSASEHRARVRAAAQEAGLSIDPVEWLIDHGPLNWNSAAVREGLFYVVGPEAAALRDHGAGLSVFTENYGGEVLYRAVEEVDASDDRAIAARTALSALRDASEPSVVRISIPPRILPGVWQVLVGTRLQLPDAHCSWALTEPVPGGAILDIAAPDE